MASQRPAGKLSFGRKLRFAAIGLAAAGGSVVFGLLDAPRVCAQSAQATAAPFPSFEVASIKPNHSGDDRFLIQVTAGRFTTTGTTTKFLIQYAYNVKPFQVSGGPSWINSERYDIDAKEEDSLVEELKRLPRDQGLEQIKLMVQSLLADRFKLKISRDTKELPVYALVVTKTGPKFAQTTVTPLGPVGTNPPGTQRGPMLRMERGQLTANGVSIGLLADTLSRQPELGGRVVLDQTGLKSDYDFMLQWTPEDPIPNGLEVPSSRVPPDASGPSIFTALQEQLGLKLESTKGPVDTIVIDHVEEPSPN